MWVDTGPTITTPSPAFFPYTKLNYTLLIFLLYLESMGHTWKYDTKAYGICTEELSRR